MRSFAKISLALFALMTAFTSVDAAVRLPKVVSDGMVLQREVNVTVWGWAEPGEKVTVRFDGKHYFTEADNAGNWEVKMDAHGAGGPYVLEVNEIILRDILVGDVWLLSGQSNQETPIERLVDKYPEIPVSNNHMIRMYKVPTQNSEEPLDEIATGERWHSGVAADIMSWKALAYFYAVEAYEKTGIPQGMMISSLGGSNIERWISNEYLPKVPAPDVEVAPSVDYADPLAGTCTKESYDDTEWDSVEMPNYLANSGISKGIVYFRKLIDVPACMAGRHAKIYMGRLVDGDQVFVNGALVGQTSYFGPPRKYNIPAGVLHEGKNVVAVRLTASSGDAGFVPDKPYRIVGDEGVIDLTGSWKYKVSNPDYRQPASIAYNVNGGLYNGMIHPLKKYDFAGVIWYQGESNTSRADEYEGLLTKLIANWRELFERSEMPVLICQLPNYMDKYDHPTDSDWARLREAQFKVAQKVPYTALAVCYNTGEYNDIHPLNKKDLAKTLFVGARKLYYGENVVASGPVWQSMRIKGNKIILTFDSRLKASGTLRHFAIAGEDRQFVWAKARIRGRKVIVSSSDIPNPVAVRYAWADNPDDANLTNRNGLLASPFRTDDWEYVENDERMKFTN